MTLYPILDCYQMHAIKNETTWPTFFFFFLVHEMVSYMCAGPGRVCIMQLNVRKTPIRPLCPSKQLVHRFHRILRRDWSMFTNNVYDRNRLKYM